MFSTTFRTLYFPMIDVEFVIGAKLLLLKIDDINSSKIALIVKYIFKRFKNASTQMSVHSELSFVCKMFKLLYGYPPNL